MSRLHAPSVGDAFRRRAVPALVLALVAGLSAPLFAEGLPLLRQPASPSAISSPHPFLPAGACGLVQRELRVVRTEIVQGEPLLLEMRLRGLRPRAASDTIEFSGRLELGRDLHIAVYPAGGAPYQYDDRQARAVGISASQRFRPDDVFFVQRPLAYDPMSVSGAFLDMEGRYGLSIGLACPDTKTPGSFEAPQEVLRTVIVVRKAEGDDLKALDLLMEEPENFLALHRGRARDEGELQVLMAVVEQAPKAALRPWALMAVANGLAERALREGEVDQEKLRRALAFSEQLVREHPEHPLVNIARNQAIMWREQLGDRPGALAAFRAAWSDAAAAHMFTPGQRLPALFLGEREPTVARDWMVFARPADAMRVIEQTPEEKQAQQDQMQALIEEAVRQGTLTVIEGKR